MFKILILCCSLLLVHEVSNSQQLSNKQLLKVYGYMVEALNVPRTELTTAATSSINQYLGGLSNNWITISEDNLMRNGSEIYMTWNYKVNREIRTFLSGTYTATSKGIKPSLEFFTPSLNHYNISMRELAEMGKFQGQSRNELNGIDRLYKLENIHFLYSTIPAAKDGFKLSGKSVPLYKITLSVK